MSNESNFYIPAIEEFRVGFRYEVYEQVSGNVKLANVGVPAVYDWVKRTFELENFELIESIIDSEKVRVKVLDEADIVELGWENQQYKDCLFYKIPNTKHKMIYNDKVNYVQINFGLDFILSFKGFIRNYNELKDVMRMLEICAG